MAKLLRWALPNIWVSSERFHLSLWRTRCEHHCPIIQSGIAFVHDMALSSVINPPTGSFSPHCHWVFTIKAQLVYHLYYSGTHRSHSGSVLLTYPWPCFLLPVSVSDSFFGCYSNTNDNVIRVDELSFLAKWELDQRAKRGQQSKTNDWVCISKNKWKMLASPGYIKCTDRTEHDSGTMIHTPDHSQ